MNEIKKVKIQYFASLKEVAGLGEEVVETTVKDAKDLYQQLKDRHGFTLCSSQLRLAVNECFEPLNYQVNDGDTIVFLPPVAGG